MHPWFSLLDFSFLSFFFQFSYSEISAIFCLIGWEFGDLELKIWIPHGGKP
jgi:hypothetical protein